MLVSKLKLPLLTTLLVFVLSCGTAPRDLETPFGSRPSDQFGEFEILGVSSRITTTNNRADAKDKFSEEVRINVPPGTYLIVPSIRGWITCYGEITPDDLSNINDPNASLVYKPNDQHLGLQLVNIMVKDIDAYDPSSNSQTATLIIESLLRDDNADNKWYARVNYDLLFLGKKKQTINPNPWIREDTTKKSPPIH